MIASSKKARAIWQEHRKDFSNTISQQKAGQRDAQDDWALLTGLPRASMLLLGYATEMYLKAGIVKAYHGCSNEMFDRDIKGRFGHKFNEMAEEVAFEFQLGDRENLEKLKDMVLSDARYPVFVGDGASHTQAVNNQTSRIWSDQNYGELSTLTERLRAYVSKIDQDSSNTASFQSCNIDDDGYVAFRVGGHLPPRITYRLSTKMRDAGTIQLDDVKALLRENTYWQILRYWHQAWIYEDVIGQAKTSRRQQPPVISPR